MNLSEHILKSRTEYKFGIEYNHLTDKFIISDMDTIVKKKCSERKDHDDWVFINGFNTIQECMEYIEKMR